MTINEKKKRARRGAGFTLVEMLLVLAILAILAAIVYPNVAGRSQQARDTAAHAQIDNFKTVLGAFEVDNGYFPRGKDGLRALIEKPRDAQNWRGPYLEKIPLDPWGNPYVYECPGKHNPATFDIMSSGPDGRVGGGDDICNWETTTR